MFGHKLVHSAELLMSRAARRILEGDEMLIPTEAVANWKDLQNKVATLFHEMGYAATVEETLELRNGAKAEIDVVVRDQSASVAKLYLIECKYWDQSIPRAAVQAFKMDIWESGANFGLFVSKLGYQPGADIAAKNTNITLLTFAALQHTFGDEWFRIKRETMDKKAREIRNIHHTYFDQSNPSTIHNSVFFFQPDHAKQFALMQLWASELIVTANYIHPESYSDTSPVMVSECLTEPWRYEQINRDAGFKTYRSAREFFDYVCGGMDKFLEAFYVLEKDAHSAFERLPEEEQFVLFDASFRELVEETPIRVFKDALGTQYDRLISEQLQSVRIKRR